MPITAIINQKGGCGKTTIAVNLAAALCAHGRKVLLIDLDPQGHASAALGVNAEHLPTTFDALDLDTDLPLREIIVALSESLHLAPANILLAALEQKLSGKGGREDRLRDKTARLRKTYDSVLIDCPPNLGLLTINALLAADTMLVPVEASSFSLQAISRLMQTVAMLRRGNGHDPELCAVASMHDRRTNYARAFLERLREQFGEDLLLTVVPCSVKFKEAAQAGVPIIRYAPASAGAQAFLSLAGEILGREDSRTRRAAAIGAVCAPQSPEEREVHFAISAFGWAKEVQLAGDFNDWNPSCHPLGREGNGAWATALHLQRGRYQYKYVVDGEWLIDPGNPEVAATTIGSLNSVLTVT